MGKRAVLLVVVGLTCGCAVGPNYKKPVVNVPPAYRGVTPEEAAKGEARSLADENWWEVFQDEQLKELVKTALQQNYDVRIAAARILQSSSAPVLRLARHGQARVRTSPQRVATAWRQARLWF